jgi:hypothetical protein
LVLGGRLLHPAVNTDSDGSHADRAGDEIDVTPVQGADLPTSETGHYGQLEQRPLSNLVFSSANAEAASRFGGESGFAELAPLAVLGSEPWLR